MRTSLLLLAMVLIGCGPTAPKGTKQTKQIVSMDTVPPVVIEAAQTNQRGVKFDTVIKADGFYEVRGKDQSGKIVEVEVSETGEVLKVE